MRRVEQMAFKSLAEAIGTVNLALLLALSGVWVRSDPRIFNGLDPPGNS
jgi:hypothetical protein